MAVIRRGVRVASSLGQSCLNNFEISGNDTGVRVDVNSSLTLLEGVIPKNTVSAFCGFSGYLEVDDDEQDSWTGNGDNVMVDPACHLVGDADL